MASDEKTIIESRRGFYVGWQDIVFLFVALIAFYLLTLHLRDRGYDLSKITNLTMVVNADRVQLRNGPGTRFPVINQLPKGTRVVYLNEYQQHRGGEVWAKVQGNGNSGWVNRAFLN